MTEFSLACKGSKDPFARQREFSQIINTINQSDAPLACKGSKDPFARQRSFRLVDFVAASIIANVFKVPTASTFLGFFQSWRGWVPTDVSSYPGFIHGWLWSQSGFSFEIS